MYDLIVVGAGVAGSVLTTMARLQGKRVLLVGDREPASSAALAVLRPGWSKATDEAVSWYTLNGGVLQGAEVTRRWLPGGYALQDDWYLVDPSDVLVQPDINLHITQMAPGWAWDAGLYVGDRGLRARLVVASYPVWSSRSPDSYGATAVSLDAKLVTPGPRLRVHWLRPFHAVMAAQTSQELRVGSSVAKTALDAGKRAMQMVEQMEDAGIITHATDWQLRSGTRYLPNDWHEDRGLVMLPGFGRLGFTAAPRLARLILDRWDELAK